MEPSKASRDSFEFSLLATFPLTLLFIQRFTVIAMAFFPQFYQFVTTHRDAWKSIKANGKIAEVLEPENNWKTLPRWEFKSHKKKKIKKVYHENGKFISGTMN